MTYFDKLADRLERIGRDRQDQEILDAAKELRGLKEEEMGKYVVYEIWTSNRIIDAKDATDAYNKGEPEPRDDMSLCNWHVVRVDDSRSLDEHLTGLEVVGGLNYRQQPPEK